jgi:hypothetical protein
MHEQIGEEIPPFAKSKIAKGRLPANQAALIPTAPQ